MLLKDKILQSELEKNGFIVIPFLNDAEVKTLNIFNNTVHNNQEPPDFIDDIHMTTWCGSLDYKLNISKNLTQLFSEPCKRYFKPVRTLNHVFIVKKSGKQTTFKVHQDWNVIDETKYQSVNVWIPLHDVDETTGALWVLRNSHSLDRKVRGAGYLFPDYSEFMNELEKKAISVKLKAGEAIVFYHSVIHGSPPNLGNQSRKAACFSVIPKDAPLHIHYQPEKGLPLELHTPPDDFIFHYNHLRTETLLRPPSAKPVKILASFENKKVELKELKPFLENKMKFFSLWRK
jgi:hypothetical protein